MKIMQHQHDADFAITLNSEEFDMEPPKVPNKKAPPTVPFEPPQPDNPAETPQANNLPEPSQPDNPNDAIENCDKIAISKRTLIESLKSRRRGATSDRTITTLQRYYLQFILTLADYHILQVREGFEGFEDYVCSRFRILYLFEGSIFAENARLEKYFDGLGRADLYREAKQFIDYVGRYHHRQAHV
ncbi:hypothetical protein HDV00_010157 [Rhizophlyctis rosea]|nr:hypothetical protein HDV00_010157 [Rhizophlyctis rosea]